MFSSGRTVQPGEGAFAEPGFVCTTAFRDKVVVMGADKQIMGVFKQVAKYENQSLLHIRILFYYLSGRL